MQIRKGRKDYKPSRKRWPAPWLLSEWGHDIKLYLVNAQVKFMMNSIGPYVNGFDCHYNNIIAKQLSLQRGLKVDSCPIFIYEWMSVFSVVLKGGFLLVHPRSKVVCCGVMCVTVVSHNVNNGRPHFVKQFLKILHNLIHNLNVIP